MNPSFEIQQIEHLGISNQEIRGLLHRVYVDGGYTSKEVAEKIFEPKLVKARGQVFGAKSAATGDFAGMIIVVPPNSKAIVRANHNECELHLLGVDPKFRGLGLGRTLVSKAIEYAASHHWSKMILWTQKPMKTAQSLYESLGFLRTGEMTKSDIDFFVYERRIV